MVVVVGGVGDVLISFVNHEIKDDNSSHHRGLREINKVLISCVMRVPPSRYTDLVSMIVSNMFGFISLLAGRRTKHKRDFGR